MAEVVSAGRRATLGVILSLAALGGAERVFAQTDDSVDFPTTEFAEGATSATVTAGGVTAKVSQALRAEIDPALEVPILQITVDDAMVLEIPGVASGMDFVAAEASIAEVDPGNGFPEVYFTSYSGGAHCCNTVVVAGVVNDKWTGVTVGEFDGDGNYLNDLDGDGLAEIATVDNRFLYAFDCYACSAAPLRIMTVRNGEVFDISADPRFREAHQAWLTELEANADPEQKWESRGYLAGWVAAKIRVGEGDEAWQLLSEHWNAAADPGEEICLTGEQLEDCPRKNRATLKFPARLKLFLEETGYAQ